MILTIVRAKHSGSPFNIFSNNLSTGMLRPYFGNASPLPDRNESDRPFPQIAIPQSGSLAGIAPKMKKPLPLNVD